MENKSVITTRVIKNPHDWLSSSKKRRLTEAESEEVSYIVHEYHYSENGERLIFHGGTAFSQEYCDWVLASNVVSIRPLPEPTNR